MKLEILHSGFMTIFQHDEHNVYTRRTSLLFYTKGIFDLIMMDWKNVLKNKTISLYDFYNPEYTYFDDFIYDIMTKYQYCNITYRDILDKGQFVISEEYGSLNLLYDGINYNLCMNNINWACYIKNEFMKKALLHLDDRAELQENRFHSDDKL